MNPEHQIELEDAQKKLSVFRKHLDLLAQGSWETKNVNPGDVLAAVTELESLVEWAAQQPELGGESAVLLVKLHELHRIRQNLENSASEEYAISKLDDEKEKQLPEKLENYSKDIEDISSTTDIKLCEGNDENIHKAELVILTDDEVLCHDFEKDDKGNTEGTEFSEERTACRKEEKCQNDDTTGSTESMHVQDNLYETCEVNFIAEVRNASEEDQLAQNTTEIPDLPSGITETNSIKSSGNGKDERSTISLQSDADTNAIKSFINESEDDVTDTLKNSLEESSVISISNDTEENASKSLDDPTKSEVSSSTSFKSNAVVNSTKPFRNEVIILETNEDNKTTEYVGDSKIPNDPLDICMYAIRNLYESLRAKENELLKLSVIQNDQKHIEALQEVIIDFHKDITNLNSQLDQTKKENMTLKEQVLELEEAENDARLEAQKLEQKVLFLQEKDSHSQAELSQLRQSLKKYTEMLTEKEATEKELRSQIKYMETLVQKYEDQIRLMETKEVPPIQGNIQNATEHQTAEGNVNYEKRVKCDKGTQTYDLRQTKIKCNGENLDEGASANKCECEQSLDVSQSTQIPPKSEKNSHGCTQEDSDSFANQSSSISAGEANEPEEQVGFGNIENLLQKELLKRLHKLIDEDVNLQQQIHYVDEINLALWKKLQNLETHIGECKRQNINETAIVKNEIIVPSCGSTQETQELRVITMNNYIPPENLTSLDQNEQYIQERLTKLEEINASFEKELNARENLCKEKEKKRGEWVQAEGQLMEALKRLTGEKDSLVDQVTTLKKEKEELEFRIHKQKEDLNILKAKNETELSKIRKEQETLMDEFNLKVNQLLTKEKEILKMITNLKSEKNMGQNKNELERLKCNYIELQLELSNAREEIRKLEEVFRIRMDESVKRYSLEETPLNTELENLQSENAKCDKMINNLQLKQKNLLKALEQQEEVLHQARESYKKNLEETEEEHRSVEMELENRLREIEKGTAIATTVLMEERMRVEKELQENINDLKAKEEVYKDKIAELERNVSQLHAELHKMAEDSTIKTQKSISVQESAAEGDSDKNKEQEGSKTVLNNMPTPSETVDQPSENKSDAESHPTNSPEDISVAAANKTEETSNDEKYKEKKEVKEENVKEENVDELRAQVRELQSQLEKISGETDDMLAVKPAPTVSKTCLGIQKLEDIDYAEVDDCLDVWRKPADNSAASKTFSTQFQRIYGDRYPTTYTENLRNEKTPVEEMDEENDYDEVLPRPTNFHVVQQVGSDTLLVGWNYVNPSVLDGFEVYLNNQVHERIYIPDRTKALISGLNLKRPIHLSICALSRYGQMSEPAVLEISSPHQLNYFEEDDDEYKDFEDAMNQKQRPYSMEW